MRKFPLLIFYLTIYAVPAFAIQDNMAEGRYSPTTKPTRTNIEIGYSHGYSRYDYDYYGIDLIHGIHKPHFSTGLGIGLHIYAWDFPQRTADEKVIPIYIDFRYYPLKSKFTPYALIKGGYSVVLWEEVGVFMQAGGGLKYNYSPKHDLLINFTYGIQNFQSGSYNINAGSYKSSGFKFIESVGVAVGWSF